jgi:hypothetical protein
MSSSIDSENKEFDCYLINESTSEQGENEEKQKQKQKQNVEDGVGEMEEKMMEQKVSNNSVLKDFYRKNTEQINSKFIYSQNNEISTKNEDTNGNKIDTDKTLYYCAESEEKGGYMTEWKVEKQDGMADCLLMLQKYLNQLKDWLVRTCV